MAKRVNVSAGQFSLFESATRAVMVPASATSVDRDPDGLRWYQREAAVACFEGWFGPEGYRRLLIESATGTGKTQMFCAIAHQWAVEAKAKGLSPRVLFLAHRSELVDQIVNRLDQMYGILAHIEQADMKATLDAPMVVASVDTIKTAKRLGRFPADHFGLICVDEAHHYVAKTYRRPLDHFADAKVLLVTATPDRGDGKAMGRLVDHVAYRYSVADAMADGYLVPIDGQRVHIDSLHLEKVGMVAGDFNQGQLDDAIVEAVEGVVMKTMELGGDRKGPIFFPGVKSAELATERFNALRPGCAAFISGKTDTDTRKELVKELKAGKYQYLCNCAIATEGFDWPEASLVGQARPTKSRSLYAQIAGRGLRVLPSVIDHLTGKHLKTERKAAIATSPKPNCLILDFVGSSDIHSLSSPVDLLGGNYDEDVREKAKEKLEKGEIEGNDVAEALECSRRELQALAAAIRSKVNATVREFDPFRVMGVEWDEKSRYSKWSVPASERQTEALSRMGIDPQDLADISRKGASSLLDELNRRRKEGLCSHKQLRQLQRYGVTDTEISFTVASQAMEYIKSTAWKGKPVDASILQGIVSGSAPRPVEDDFPF